MISWKKVSEEMPPLEKEIVIAIPSGHKQDGSRWYRVFIASVHHPYDRDNKFHPDYYTVHSRPNYVTGETERLQPDDLWSLLNHPASEGEKVSNDT